MSQDEHDGQDEKQGVGIGQGRPSPRSLAEASEAASAFYPRASVFIRGFKSFSGRG